jgi:hypothetical protein
MDQISGDLKAKTQYPEDQENNKNSPQHRIPPTGSLLGAFTDALPTDLMTIFCRKMSPVGTIAPACVDAQPAIGPV